MISHFTYRILGKRDTEPTQLQVHNPETTPKHQGPPNSKSLDTSLNPGLPKKDNFIFDFCYDYL